MNNDSSQQSEESINKPVQPYEEVLNSIKAFKESRKGREAELDNMNSLKNALKSTGYESARNYIAEQVDLIYVAI